MCSNELARQIQSVEGLRRYASTFRVKVEEYLKFSKFENSPHIANIFISTSNPDSLTLKNSYRILPRPLE